MPRASNHGFDCSSRATFYDQPHQTPHLNFAPPGGLPGGSSPYPFTGMVSAFLPVLDPRRIIAPR
jgi:hypothetical protein